MRFSRLLVFILPSVLLLSACSLRIGEQPAKNKNIELGDQVGCLSNMGKVFSEFIEAKAEVQQLEDFGECAAFSIQSFLVYTVGEDPDQYRPNEIRDFLQKYFLKKQTISDDLLNQAMNLKILILGGTKTAITRQELVQLIEIIKVWKQQLVDINPFMPLFLGVAKKGEVENISSQQVYAAVAGLESFVRGIVGTFRGQGLKYDWNDFKILVHELREITQWKGIYPNVRPLEEWVHLVQSFRQFNFNESDPRLSLAEMPEFFNDATDWLSILIQYYYLIANKTITTGEGLVHFDRWMNDVYNRLEVVFSRHPNHQIAYRDIHQFLIALESFFNFPLKLTAHDINEFFPSLISKVLRERNQGSQVAFTSPDKMYLKNINLKIAFKIYSEWYEIQKYIDANYPNDEHGEYSYTASRSGSLNAKIFGASPEEGPIGELKRIIQNVPPLYTRGEDRVMLVEINRAYRFQLMHGFYNLTKMNLFRTIISFGMRGYAQNYVDRPPLGSTMTADEVQNLYQDIKPLGIKLGILDPRTNSAGYRSFNESNLFTYVSDGLGENAEMSFEEGMLLLSYLWSGSAQSRKVYNFIAEICEKGPLDIRNEEKLQRNCAEQNIGRALLQNIDNMPSLKSHLASMNELDLNTYGQKLMLGAYNRYVNDVEWVEKSELDVVSMIMIYTESVFTRFNINGNQYLEAAEINAALPVFSEFTRNIAKDLCIGDLSDRQVGDAFRAIVSTGKIPDTSNAWKLAVFAWDAFWRRRPSWEVQLDRTHLNTVFASVIAQSVSNGNGGVKKCKPVTHNPRSGQGKPRQKK